MRVKNTVTALLPVLLLSALFFNVAAGCAWEKRVKHLDDVEFNHYYALRPFMSDPVRKAYLKLKTEEERNQFLKDRNLWDMFYKYSEPERQAIIDGDVQVGWSRDKVLMAWGAPYDKRKLVGRPATRSELLVYRFEVQEDGSILVYEPGSKTEYKAVRHFERRVIVDDDVVAEIEEVDGWH